MDETRNSRARATRRDSFIVRIWCEGGRPGWKAWVQHAGTGESAMVQELDGLLDFIEARTDGLRLSTRRGIR
ncbi:MAG TPA: hypothetical protein PKO09_05945 [Anaerolineae bacterium]|nr:hypothetical protein [Anaerolineae bacterium]